MKTEAAYTPETSVCTDKTTGGLQPEEHDIYPLAADERRSIPPPPISAKENDRAPCQLCVPSPIVVNTIVYHLTLLFSRVVS